MHNDLCCSCLNEVVMRQNENKYISRYKYTMFYTQVLFPLLDNVKKFSSTAPTTKDESTQGNILIHHSRDTAEKQWAETRVLTLAGVARTFTAQRKILQGFCSKFMSLDIARTNKIA